MSLALRSVRTNFRPWEIVIVLLLIVSVLLGAAGFAFKAQIVRMLPAADEVAGPPTGILHFLDQGIDSWKPMKLALTIFHSEAGDQIYETLRNFQLSGDGGLAGDLSHFADTKKFQYPLTSLLPIEVLGAVGLDSIRSLNVINLIMYLAGIAAVGFVAVQCFGSSSQTSLNETYIFLFAALASLTFYPIFVPLVLGNMQLWIDCFFAFACLAWLRGRAFLAGFLIALAATIKPQFAAMLIWALLWRQWLFCGGFLSVAIPVALASVLYFGLHNNLAYLDLLRLISQHGETLSNNESVNGIVHRLIEDGGTGILLFDKDNYAPYRPVVYIFTMLSTLVFALIAFLPPLLRRGEQPTIIDFSIASICFTIGAPIVWRMHYGTLLPIYIIALKFVLDEPDPRARMRLAIMLGASWLLCASYLPFFRLLYESPWNLAANPHFFAALLLLAVLLRWGGVWQRRGAQRLARFA
jgi:Glycosyltransferase family 87